VGQGATVRSVRELALALLLTTLAACGGGGGSSPPPMTLTIGGTVTGLTGSGLILQMNGGANLAIAAAGAFSFPQGLVRGTAYSVTVAVQPSSPAQSCSVTNGSGAVPAINVSDIVIDCAPAQFVALTNQPPEAGFLAMLLTDGSVMMQSNNDAGVFYRLTPDTTGSYVNGSWSQLASPPAGYAPADGAEAVLADGRVLFVGGEYNDNQYNLPFAPSGLTNMSAVYDPVADAWTMIGAPPGVAYIGDAVSAVLPDGSFAFGDKLGRDMWRLDPATLTWSSLPAAGKADDFAEEGWTLLPDGDLFTIDVGNVRHAEHYDPATGQWYSDGSTPELLSSPTGYPDGLTYGPAPQQVVGGVSYGPGPTGTYLPPGEIGPALLLPDGTVFATGASVNGAAPHTVIYTPPASAIGAGSFASGPDFPVGEDVGDSSAALLPSGHVLIAGLSGQFYEYGSGTLQRTGALTTNGGNTQYFVLPLPNGQALVTGGLTGVYTGAGTADPRWAPTITAAPAVIARGSSYAIAGTQFNGLSQAAAFGDELNAATNYPLVRLTNASSGHIAYLRTHGHSSMGVATGSTIVSTSFDVPASLDTGASSLVVVANGIPSAPVSVNVN
jgi:hypothetical protein